MALLPKKVPHSSHTGYDQSQEIHSKPRRMSLLFGKAQLAGCLKVWASDPLEWNADIQ